MVIVYGEGPPRADLMVVGEAPGFDEAREKRPFVGRTGKAQDDHFKRNGLHRRKMWLTNLNKYYREGNPEPTPEDIEHWGPYLLDEVRKVRPRVILTAGHHATRFFLGDVTLDAVHGMPQRSPLTEAVVMPSYHPAAPFYAPDLLQFVNYDYRRFAEAARGEIDLTPACDTFAKPVYLDLDHIPRASLDLFIDSIETAVAIDTEGVPGDEWSLQLSVLPGAALVVRRSSAHFDYFRRRFMEVLRRRRPTVVFHNALYDVEMLVGLGLPLLQLDLPLFDSMMAAYLMCVEPQGLKALARRWCGMVMQDYEEVVGDVGRAKQIAYLERVVEAEWPPVEPRVEWENDGTSRLYKPKHVAKVAEAILVDVWSGKATKEGPTDPMKRWRKVDVVQRRMVEKAFGRMPVGTLADIPLPEAVHYAGRDSDATIRLYPKLSAALDAQGLAELMSTKMSMLPCAIEMKMNGLMGRRESFEALSEDMWDKMLVISGKISKQFYSGRPFNPGSPDQVAVVMRRRGLQGVKKTPTGKVSTSKKSIEHLRFTDPAIAMIEDWREHQKIRDSFALPVLENWPEGAASVRIRTDLKVTRVTSGRFSGTLLDDVPSAPLLAIPVRNVLGQRVRDCYEAEEGYELCSFDLDQAEMRVMADESRDPVLVKLFREGKRDVHSDTASKIFGYKYEQIEGDKALRKKLRDPAKRAGFGVITGIQGSGLSDQLRMAGAKQVNGAEWDPDSCDDLIQDWFRIYKGVKQYLADCKQECRDSGGVIRDRWGMPRYLPAVFSEERHLRWEAERQTHSHKIQGGAQGGLQRTMAWLRPRLAPYGDAVRWILQIHDELLFEVALGMREIVEPIILEGMTQHGLKLCVPVKSSGSFAHSWGQLK